MGRCLAFVNAAPCARTAGTGTHAANCSLFIVRYVNDNLYGNKTTSMCRSFHWFSYHVIHMHTEK